MNLDIQTISTTIAILLLGNGIISFIAWKNAKLERRVFGYWSIGQILICFGMILVALRGEITIFLSVIVGNALVIGGQIATQEGIAVYAGKKGRYRHACLSIFCLMSLGFIYWTYANPSVNLRIVLYSVSAACVSLLSIITLQKKERKINAPEKAFICLQGMHIFLLIFRSFMAVVQNEYITLFHSSFAQKWGLMGLLSYYSSQSLCFFWLVARRLSMEVQRQAITDPLTGLFNRRAMDDALQKFSPQNGSDAIGFLLIDVDRFKEMNDQHGHPAGDAVLVRLGAEIKGNLRADDLAFRYAGDEMAAIIRNCNAESLLHAAERLRKKVEDMEIPWDGKILKITISIGATLSSDPASRASLIKNADEALYEAKAAGKNQVKLGFAKIKTDEQPK